MIAGKMVHGKLISGKLVSGKLVSGKMVLGKKGLREIDGRKNGHRKIDPRKIGLRKNGPRKMTPEKLISRKMVPGKMIPENSEKNWWGESRALCCVCGMLEYDQSSNFCDQTHFPGTIFLEFGKSHGIAWFFDKSCRLTFLIHMYPNYNTPHNNIASL